VIQLDCCVAQRIYSLTFPATGGTIVVTYPYVLTEIQP